MIYPWQQNQWQHIVTQHQQQHMPQALLLTGIDGLGQFDFAKTVAQLVLCEQPGLQPCNQCRHCHLFLKESHPDFYCIEAIESSRVIKIDQIRHLIDRVAKTPQLARSQVVVINTLDLMNVKASNALLKTLEEPNGDVLFMLICHRLGSVPVTVVSRTQRLHFFLDDEKAALQWLSDNTATEHADIILRIADQAPLRAKKLVEDNILSLRDQLLKKLLFIAKGDNPLSGVSALLKQDVYDVLMLLRLLLNDIRRIQLEVNAKQLTNFDCAADLKKLAAHYSVQRLQSQLDAIMKTEQVLRAGVHINPQLALESIFVT
jgi:DNA polymerase-3 subunit delta'